MGAAKHEWKKHEKAWYGAAATPAELDVPAFGFFVVEGKGDPNQPEFQRAVELLFSVAWAVRMAPKAGLALPGYSEYTVYPLEGVWDSTAPVQGYPIDKSTLVYRLMIRQPDFLTAEAAALVLASVARKKPTLGLDRVTFETVTEGRCVQMLHTGPYDDEPASFSKIRDFCRKESLARVGHSHREIYLSDFRKTAPSALKTILRVPVRDHYSCD